MSRSTMAKVFEDAYQRKSGINFTDSEQYYEIGLNRTLAIDEEFLRRNFFGDISKIYVYKSLEFYEYLKKVAEKNETYAINSTGFLVLFIGISYLIFVGYVIRESMYMKTFYVSLFKVKVSQQSYPLFTTSLIHYGRN